MAAKPKKIEKKDTPQINIYDVLNKWLYDGSSTTPIPNSVLEAKNLSQHILLYHFSQSKYIVYLSELFNNYSIYQLEKSDVFRFFKECVNRTNFRPKFMKRVSDDSNKLQKFLMKQYPYLKLDDVKLLSNIVEQSDIIENIYEMMGITKTKKKKSDKKEFAKLLESTESVVTEDDKEEQISLNDVLSNFE